MATRASNWCEEEIEVLIDLCSGKSLGEMNAVFWDRVTERVNSVGTCVRPPKKVKKKWSDIKSATKTKAMAIKSVVVQTGGGPPPKPLSALQEKVLSVLPDCITMGITGGIDTFLTIGFFEDSDSKSYSLISGEKSTDTVRKKKRVNKKRKCDCHDELLAIERKKLELFEEIVHLKRESLCFKKLKHSTTNVFE